MKKIFGILLLITSCNSEGNKQIKINTIETALSTVGERMVVPIEPDSLNDRSNVAHYLIEKFSKEYEGLKDKDVIEVKLTDSASVKNFGSIQVYKIKLSDNLPEVFTKSNYLIVSKNKKQGTLFLLDTIVFIKTSINDNTILLGGIQKIKAKGFFLIYDFAKENKFKEILNSLDYCENGIPVFNNSIDCISYKPFMLSFKNIDINNDSLLDINFSGQVASYCKGLEMGYGRNDRKPITLTKIDFSFMLKSENISTHFKYDFVQKDSVCDLIK